MQEVETRNRGIQGIKEKTGLFIAGFVFAEREIFCCSKYRAFYNTNTTFYGQKRAQMSKNGKRVKKLKPYIKPCFLGFI